MLIDLQQQLEMETKQLLYIYSQISHRKNRCKLEVKNIKRNLLICHQIRSKKIKSTQRNLHNISRTNPLHFLIIHQLQTKTQSKNELTNFPTTNINLIQNKKAEDQLLYLKFIREKKSKFTKDR